MKSSFKKLPGSKIELEVSLIKGEFLPYFQAVNDEALKSAHLKGFRPGTAPKEMAEAAVDKDKVFSEAVKSAVRWSLDEITKDNEWTLIDAPKIEIKDTGDLGLQYKAELTVFPEVKLGNYKKIAKKVWGEKKESAVEQKEIDQVLEFIRNSRKEKDKEAPELNDEFAKSLGKFENLEALKKNVSDGLLMEKSAKEKERLEIKMLSEIIKDSEIDLPEVMVEKTFQRMEKQYAPALKAAGKKPEEISKELREKARENVASNLVVYKIAQAEKLEPTPEEIEKSMGSVENNEKYQYYYGIIQQRKVFNFLESQQGNH